MTVHDHRKLAAYSEHTQDAAALAIKRVTAHAIARVNDLLLHDRYRISDSAIRAAFSEQETATEIVALTKDYATRPARKAREVYEDYIAGVAERAGLKKNAQMRLPFETQYTATMFTDAGTVEQYIAKFYDNFDLSGAVWKDVGNQQDKIIAVIRGGIAQGRDPVEIARDLEIFLKYRDGGKRVLGRWRTMVPPGREAAALSEEADDLIARGILPPNDKADWVKERLKTGATPHQVEQYIKRIGEAGLDYRVIRIVRTETQFFLQEEQKQIASDPITTTGKVQWILDAAHRDERCLCGEYAKGMVGGTHAGTPDGVYDVDKLPKPPHPNCLTKENMVDIGKNGTAGIYAR